MPALIGVSLVLVATGPRLSRALQEHRHAEAHKSWPLALAFDATAVYGGYFGAAMGDHHDLPADDLHCRRPPAPERTQERARCPGQRVAGLLFVAVAPVDWSVALLIAFGSIVGGQIGSRVGRRLPPPALRTIIICVGIAAEAKLMMG